MKTIISTIILFVALIANSFGQYNLTQIPTPIGGSNFMPSNINRQGTISALFYKNGKVVSILLYKTGYRIIRAPGADCTYINDINNSGEFDGFAQFPSGRTVGFVKEQPVDHYVFNTFPNSVYTQGMDASEINRKVGYFRSVNGKYHGYSYLGGKYVQMDYPGATATFCISVNLNTIVGIAYLDEFFEQEIGWTYSNGEFKQFVVPYKFGDMELNAVLSYPERINANGVIVGSFQDFNNIEHGFVYENGQFTTIDYPNALLTEVTGINDLGQIVGRYYDGTESRGFIGNKN